MLMSSCEFEFNGTKVSFNVRKTNYTHIYYTHVLQFGQLPYDRFFFSFILTWIQDRDDKSSRRKKTETGHFKRTGE